MCKDMLRIKRTMTVLLIAAFIISLPVCIMQSGAQAEKAMPKTSSKNEIINNSQSLLSHIQLTEKEFPSNLPAIVDWGASGEPRADEVASMADKVDMQKEVNLVVKTNPPLQLRVSSGDKIVIYELHDNVAARQLYNQLPLIIEVKDYGNSEKIFYPPEKLNTANLPLASARSGTLAYYAPWGNVVMFYEDFHSANGLYELGYAVSGNRHIKDLTGTIELIKNEHQ